MQGFITLSNIRLSSTPPPTPNTDTLMLDSSWLASSAQGTSPVLVSIRRALRAATNLRLPAKTPPPPPLTSVVPYSVTAPVSR